MYSCIPRGPVCYCLSWRVWAATRPPTGLPSIQHNGGVDFEVQYTIFKSGLRTHYRIQWTLPQGPDRVYDDILDACVKLFECVIFSDDGNNRDTRPCQCDCEERRRGIDAAAALCTHSQSALLSFTRKSLSQVSFHMNLLEVPTRSRHKQIRQYANE